MKAKVNNMKKTDNPNPGWVPEFTLDLNSTSGQRFQEVVDLFEKSTKALTQVPPLPFKRNGWSVITPEISEICLRHNRLGKAWRVSLSRVIDYATQMRTGALPKTGEPIIFTVGDELVDGQDRLWACYLGSVSFEAFVVMNVPVSVWDRGRNWLERLLGSNDFIRQQLARWE
jgi:hypothetical protein